MVGQASTRKESMRRKGGPENTSCKYRGVRQRTWGKWVSEICKPNRGERIWLGSFDDSKTAALAYDEAAIRIFGPTAKINFPDQLPQMSLPVHTTASNSQDTIIDQDAIVNQRLSEANAEHNFLDMPNFIERLIEMQQGEYPPGDEVCLIANPYACLINDHVYDYHDQFILHERLRSVAQTVDPGKFQRSNVMKNDKYQKEKHDDNKEKMSLEFPKYDDSSLRDEGIETTSSYKMKDLGVDIAGISEYVGTDDLEGDLGSINFWF